MFCLSESSSSARLNLRDLKWDNRTAFGLGLFLSLQEQWGLCSGADCYCLLMFTLTGHDLVPRDSAVSWGGVGLFAQALDLVSSRNEGRNRLFQQQLCFLSASKVSSQEAGQGWGEGKEPASTWVSWFQSTCSDCSLGLFEEQCHLELLALSNTKFMLCWQCPFHWLPNAKVPEKSGSGGHATF